MSRSDVESRLGLNKGPLPGHRRLRLVVAYCGTPWRGWQGLAIRGGIQDELAAAVLKATRAETVVHGSGRTDAGVHALAQVAHMDVPVSLRMSDEAWVNSINACLPLSIRIVEVSGAEPTFHSRYDAKGKVYRYRIWRSALLSPFEADRVWQVHGPLDMEALKTCLQSLVGTHNFVCLSANRGDMPETLRRVLTEKTTRTLYRAELREEGDLLELEFEGDGFLYKMVRLIVGSLVQVARGRATVEWFQGLLTDAQSVQSNQMAPAAGLYLVRVLY
ncbi:tRNA pseudouridine(38-40) synthase TruA [Prosthecobacter sp. SYSU 5D2]|uniref:tRNA pseudouridine(38-40) synthase TruA n=1 Tax=Prosthecobacter sp. SYSU 5D2 TaxID=3134134 RepID=UPI0031FE64FF